MLPLVGVKIKSCEQDIFHKKIILFSEALGILQIKNNDFLLLNDGTGNTIGHIGIPVETGGKHFAKPDACQFQALFPTVDGLRDSVRVKVLLAIGSQDKRISVVSH